MQETKSKKPLLVGVIILVVIIVIGMILTRKSGVPESEIRSMAQEDTVASPKTRENTVESEQLQENTVVADPSTNNDAASPTEPAPTPAPATAPIETPAEKRTFTVTAKNFSLSPAEIRVKKGETIKIVFTNESGFHDFVIDEFNVRTPQINGPATKEVEFVADKTGQFEYYCSVGSHRAMGMKGTLIVE